MNYLREHGTKATPQSEPIPGSGQTPNSAGGFVWQVDDWMRLRRFLILGSEGGSYYASERKLTGENVDCIRNCVAADGPRTVAAIVTVSDAGRAPSNDPAIYALAACTALGDDRTRAAAFEALPEVCRTGTHLFHFAAYVETMRGWGRGLRKAVAAWYESKSADQLAYQLVKYRQRDGWSHRDLLRLAHPTGVDDVHKLLYSWVVQTQTEGDREHTKLNESLPRALHAFEAAQAAKTPSDTAALIREYGGKLPREALQTEHLNTVDVWAALVEMGMPITALIRNLATMTRIGLIDPTGAMTREIAAQIADPDRLRQGRVHPIAVLMAARTYGAGRGLRGSNTWNPVAPILDALDAAFYAAFDNIKPTGKRRMLALDISGSMWSGMVAGIIGFTPAEAAGAMALVSMKSGDPYEVVAFTTASRGYYGGSRRDAPAEVIPGLSVHALSSRQRLDDVLSYTRELSSYMGGTDCSLPMVYADTADREIDVFEIFTDSETWAGSVHPAEALRSYRQNHGIDAKLIVHGMVSNGFTIADPDDGGMLDVVGFDSAVPTLVDAFVCGEL